MNTITFQARGLRLGVLLALLAIGPAVALAQDEPAESVADVAEPATEIKATGQQPEKKEPRVIGAVPYQPRPEGRTEIGLADVLEVRVSDLAALIGPDGGCTGLRLVLNGGTFTSPLPYKCDPAEKQVLFVLDLLDRTGKAWTDLLAARKRHEALVDVSLSFEGAEPLKTDARGVKFILMNQVQGLWALAGYVLLVIAFLILARRTQMLRDTGPKSDVLRPYSLARVQTAWWTLLVLGAFLHISLLTGTAVAIPASILGLMGIAAGTFLGAELVESNPKNEAANGDAGAKPPAQADDPPAVSEGFVRDILSDGSGITFHRFQMAIWTVTLGGLFIIKVGKNLAMPEFDATLLGLMGISNGTYIGMKMGEKGK